MFKLSKVEKKYDLGALYLETHKPGFKERFKTQEFQQIVRDVSKVVDGLQYKASNAEKSQQK